MKKLAVLFFAVLAIGFTFLANVPAASAKAAPDEALVGINTGDETIYGLAGEKPLFLNFWATWCPPCVGEMPAIEAMYKKYGDRIGFAAVSFDNSASDAQKMIAERGMTVPVYACDQDKMSSDYSIDAIPRSILIGKDGTIIAEHVGAMTEAELEAFLSKAL